MAARIPNGSSKTPRARSDGCVCFYPAEVVVILGLDGIDYAQLLRLRDLVRGSRKTERGWSRYDLHDLAALKIAIELAGGLLRLRSGRRLHIAPVERACEELRAIGFDDPLMQVSLARTGSAIVAGVSGVAFEPANGQLVLPIADVVQDYLRRSRRPVVEGRQIRNSVSRLRPRPGRTQARREPATVRYARSVAVGARGQGE
jgi:hypothetical protein